MKTIINHQLTEHIDISKSMFNLIDQITLASNKCLETLENKGKIILFGNGGSAADAQHIAAELVGRYKNNRKPLASIALTTDTSGLTCISNDFGYEFVFSRQVEALARPSDTIIGISTGGTSKNVINGLIEGNKIGCTTIGLSGKDGGDFNDICDLNIIVGSNITARIQEMHILIGHIICEIIDYKYESK